MFLTIVDLCKKPFMVQLCPPHTWKVVLSLLASNFEEEATPLLPLQQNFSGQRGSRLRMGVSSAADPDDGMKEEMERIHFGCGFCRREMEKTNKESRMMESMRRAVNDGEHAPRHDSCPGVTPSLQKRSHPLSASSAAAGREGAALLMNEWEERSRCSRSGMHAEHKVTHRSDTQKPVHPVCSSKRVHGGSYRFRGSVFGFHADIRTEPHRWSDSI